MTSRPSYLAGVLALGLALAACSSSGGGNAAGSSPPVITPTTPATTATTSVITSPPVVTSSSTSTGGTAPSHDALNAIVVQQGDVPADYTSQAPDTSSDDQANQAKVIACVGATGVNPADRIEEVHSNDFVKDPQTISSDATSYKSQAAVDALVAVITNPKAQDCFKTLLQEQVASSGGSVTAANIQISPGSNGGPSNVVALLQGSIDISAQGQKATLSVVEAFIQGRQVFASVSAEAINAQVDVEAFKTAGKAVADRAAAA